MLIELNVQRIQAFFGDYILLAIVSFHIAIIHVWLYASMVIAWVFPLILAGNIIIQNNLLYATYLYSESDLFSINIRPLYLALYISVCSLHK